MSRDPDPPLTQEELESLLKISRLNWRYDVPEEHVETLFQAGYITKSAINPITRPGLRRLAKDFKPPTNPPLSPSAIASLRWMAHIGRIENVPWDHIEILRRAGYITDFTLKYAHPSRAQMARPREQDHSGENEPRRSWREEDNSSPAILGRDDFGIA